MSEINDGGPAFPVSTRMNEDGSLGHQDGYHTWQFVGLTMRDYFAAKAMQGMLSGYHEWAHLANYEQMALRSYGIADAMLKAREA